MSAKSLPPDRPYSGLVDVHFNNFSLIFGFLCFPYDFSLCLDLERKLNNEKNHFLLRQDNCSGKYLIALKFNEKIVFIYIYWMFVGYLLVVVTQILAK